MTKLKKKEEKTMIIRSWDDVPEFSGEAEEIDYWGSHSFGEELLQTFKRGMSEEIETASSSNFVFSDIFYSRYKVPDLVNDLTRVVFVLESPDADEVFSSPREEMRYPAAGRTGKVMTKRIFNTSNNVPFGFLLKYPETLRRYGFPNMSHVGLMNACSLPLNVCVLVGGKNCKEKYDVYAPRDKKRYQRELEGFRKVHVGVKDEEAYKYVISLFAERLELLLLSHENLLLIPCGKVAQKLVKEGSLNYIGKRVEILKDVPHPSRDWEINDTRLQRKLREALEIVV